MALVNLSAGIKNNLEYSKQTSRRNLQSWLSIQNDILPMMRDPTKLANGKSLATPNSDLKHFQTLAKKKS